MKLRTWGIGLLCGLLLGTLLSVPPMATTPSWANTLPQDSCRAVKVDEKKENGHFIQGGLRIEPIFANRMYADFRAGYDAMYIGYRVTNNTGATIQNAWITLDDWSASPAISLASAREGDQRIGTLTNGQTVTKFFLVRASSYATAAQSHAVRLWKDGYREKETLACTSTIQGVQRSLAARANKVTGITATAPVLGGEMTITVTGAPGQVGPGSAPDFDVMTLSPTTFSAWPSNALRLKKVSAKVTVLAQERGTCASTNSGGQAGTGNDRTVTFENRLILREFQKCASNKGAYTIIYTFDVVGSIRTNPAILPVSDISSGTQIKYTGGYPSGTPEVKFSEMTVPDSISKATVTKDYVDDSARIENSRLLLDYRITASTTEISTLTLDELVDNAPPGATMVASSATFTDVNRTTQTGITPIPGGSAEAPVFRFVGPFSLSKTSTKTTPVVLDYTLSVPFENPSVYTNSAFGLFGSYTVGSNTNTVSGIELTVAVAENGELTVREEVVTKKSPQTITFTLPEKLGEGSSVTLNGFSDSGLPLTYDAGNENCVVTEFAGVWTVTMVGGNCTVTAYQDGDDQFEAATPVTRTIEGLPGQTISFTAPTLTGGVTSGTLEVSSTSLLEVEVVNLTPDECSVTKVVGSFDPVTGISQYSVEADGPSTGGACILVASQAGNDDPNAGLIIGAAPDVDITIGLGKLQRVFFLTSNPTSVQLPNPMPTPPPETTLVTVAYDGPTGTLEAMLPITLTSLTPSVCSIKTDVSGGDILSGYDALSGKTSTNVSLLQAGECQVQGDQDGYKDDGDLSAFGAAAPVTYTFTVLPSGLDTQVVTLTNPGNKTYGDPVFSVQAVSRDGDGENTGLLVTLSVTSGPCVIGPSALTSEVSSAQVSVQSGGTCVIRATQGGNSTFRPADATTAEFTVAPKKISVEGLSIPARVYDASTTVIFAGTPALTGVVPGDTASHVGLTGAPTAVFTSPNVGEETLTVGGLNLTGTKVSSSYLLEVLTLTGEISERPITLTPNNQSIQAGSDPPASCTITVGGDGLALGDDITSLQCDYGLYANQQEESTYDISLVQYSLVRNGQSVAANYKVLLGTGLLTTSTFAVLVITTEDDEDLENFEIVYGEKIPEDRLKEPRAKKDSQNFAQGEFVHKRGTEIITKDTKLAVGPHTLTVEFVPEDGEDAVVSPTSRVITITPRPVSYSFSAPTKVYDGTSTVTLSGFSLEGAGTPGRGVVSGDDVSLQAPGEGTLDSAQVGSHSLSWEDATLTGENARNYELFAPGPKTGDILQRPLTIRVGSHARLVGEPNPSFAIVADAGGQNSGLAPDQTLDQVLGAERSVTVVDFTSDLVGEYTLRPDTPAASTNYQITPENGVLYVASVTFTLEETNGVLDNRVVRCDCEGMLPGTAILGIRSEYRELETIAVGSDGTCTSTTVTLPGSDVIPDGPHTLELQAVFPTSTPVTVTRPIVLETRSRLFDPEPNIDSDSGDNQQSPPPATQNPGPQQNIPPSNNPPAVPPFLRLSPLLPGVSSDPTSPRSGLAPQTLTPQVSPLPSPGGTETPRTLGLPGLRLLGSDSLAGQARNGVGFDTIDFGLPDGSSPSPGGTLSAGTRTLQQISQEKFGGFSPGSSTTLEILGTRSAARFVLTETSQIDGLLLQRAIEESIPAQATDFFALHNVRPASQPIMPPAWDANNRQAVADFFAASGLSAPRNLVDLELGGVQNWMLVEASASTYAPGTEVFLIVTSDPIVIGSTVVDNNGEAALVGTIPVDLLGLGEHRIRLVGIRSLDSAFVEADGSVGLTQDLLAEIQRFDLGTQSTIAVYGENPDGANHVALRVVPLLPVAPWWTLWLIGIAAVLGVAARFLARPARIWRRSASLALALGAIVPGVVLGWQSTVVEVTWWSLGLGLCAAVLAAFGPYRRSNERPAKLPENTRV
jgi:hypothetical protein